MKWAKRVATLMRERNGYINCVNSCERQGLIHLGMVAQHEVDKLENKLVRLIKPKLFKEVVVGVITDEDIQRARDYPIENLFDGKTKGIRCVFHDDERPSASIKFNRLRCFVCNKSFDSISVKQQLDGIGFTEAVRQLR